MVLAFQIKLSIFIIVFTFLIDWYSWQAFKTLLLNKSKLVKKTVLYAYWLVPFVVVLFTILGFFMHSNKIVKAYFPGFYFVTYISKFVICLFILTDDIKRLVKFSYHFCIRKAKQKLKPIKTENPSEAIETEERQKISRSQFLAKTGLLIGSVPFVILSRGIVKGAYDYRIRRVQLYLPNLPSGFEGVKILQISDVHTGSFNDRDAVYKGIQMIKKEEADLIFFTGDIVNNKTSELYDWQNIFAEISAPMGVFSIYGNHDYGDYVSNWKSPAEKKQNLADLAKAHHDMGWHLLRNEHITLVKNNQRIGIIGVENWGDRGRFQKYGDIEKATKAMPDVPVKLLLSHDPSHFDKIVSKNHPEIDVTFSGHTHGFQFGVEIGNLKWSPSQYIYPHWAGLYKEGNQQLYVNRGFGFLGYPGRVGILPEITVFTLTKNA